MLRRRKRTGKWRQEGATAASREEAEEGSQANVVAERCGGLFAAPTSRNGATAPLQPSARTRGASAACPWPPASRPLGPPRRRGALIVVDDDDDDSNSAAGDATASSSSCFAPLRRPRPPPPSDPTGSPSAPSGTASSTARSTSSSSRRSTAWSPGRGSGRGSRRTCGESEGGRRRSTGAGRPGWRWRRTGRCEFLCRCFLFSPLFLLLEEEKRGRTREEGKQKLPFSRNKKNKFQPLIPPPSLSLLPRSTSSSPPSPQKQVRPLPAQGQPPRRRAPPPEPGAPGRRRGDRPRALSGHVHSFARSCNAAGLRCGPRARGGAVHYTLGAAGASSRASRASRGQPAWIAAAEDMWGFLRIDADGERGSLTASFVRARDGSVGDSVVLYAAERPPSHACRGWGGRGRGARRGEGAGGNASVKIEASIE